MERALPEHGAQTRKIVIQRIEHAEPVAAAIDFEALDGGQSVVRLDEPGVRFRSDSIGAGERLHHRMRHSPLQLEKGHKAAATGAWMYFSALSASECTSSKDGIRSSHSSRVAVGPIRRVACSYIFQTGSITG